MRVLVATDGSDDAAAAAAAALPLLAPAATIVVACIVEPPAVESAGLESGFVGGMAEPEEIDAAWEAVNREADEAIDRTLTGLSSDAEIVRCIEPGAPGPVLCRLAEEQAADILVVGSRGRGAIRRALLGSVSTHVVNNAPCPVVVVRPDGD